MFDQCLRMGLLAAALGGSFQVAAAPRYWTLADVGFYGGPHASGYFSYDDATQTLSNWNVEVDAFYQGLFFPGFAYVPGNSTASVIQPLAGGPTTLRFSATIGVPGPSFGKREFQITPVAALDGSNACVSIVNSGSREDFPVVEEATDGPSSALSWVVVAGSVTLTASPPTATIVQVDEFYHSGLQHYFITDNAAEKQALDTGVHSGWQRTGESFKAYAKGSNTTSGSINPVCRFYSPAEICTYYGTCAAGPDSHFFSADAGECVRVSRGYGRLWQQEYNNAFQIDLPDRTTGACPAGTIPVYRLWNQRVDSNHRYTTSATIKAQMLAAGSRAEGYGDDGVVMCAVQ